MSWTVIGSLPVWNVTDLDLLIRMQYALLDNSDTDATGSNFVTSQIGAAELIDNMNITAEKFMRDSGPIVMRATQGTLANVARYALPADWIYTRRLTWQAQAAGSKIRSLARTDAYALDHAMLDWQQSSADPSVYNDGSNLPTLTVELLQAPVQSGTAGLMYVPQPTTFTGLGVSLNIPDEFESALLYGTLGESLSSEGEASDPERAEYCAMRYGLCVEMAQALMEGSW